MEKNEAGRGALTCWQWIEKALRYILEREGLSDRAVSKHRPASGENEPDSRNGSVSVAQIAYQPWMSVSVKHFSPVCCHLCVSSQVVSAHKWIRFNRLKIFSLSSFRNMPFYPSAHTPEILY